MIAILTRSFWLFLLVGLLIRIWNVSDPIVDAMHTRQGQTADAIRSLIEEPGFQLDSNTSWRGTRPARLILELPVYSLLTQGLYEVFAGQFYGTHPPKPGGADPHLIDISARITSVIFWALSFFLVQGIWSRFLTAPQLFWANCVFVFAPLSVFFGQAVMLEMVFLAASLAFVLTVLRYAERPSLLRFGLVILTALIGCLMKFPAFSHLGLLAIAILWRAHGLRFLFRPIHFVGAAVVLVGLKWWSAYVTFVNVSAFSFWTSEETLRSFLGTFHDRISPELYLKVAGYIAAFILSPLGAVFAGVGIFQVWKQSPSPARFFLLAWCGSSVVYLLVWGVATAGQHSYYNIPFLVPAAMLFATGIVYFVDSLHAKFSLRLARAVTLLVCAALFIPMAVMSAYLFREDRILVTTADWIRNNVPVGEPVAIKLNHRPQTIDYMHVPVVAYYSGHPCFMLTKYTPKGEYELGLSQCRFLVETLPQKPDALMAFATKLKGADRPIDPLTRAQEVGFVAGPVLESGIRIWTK